MNCACGHALGAEDRFCPGCGAAAAPVSQAAPAFEIPAEVRDASKKHLWGAGGAALLSMIMVALAVAGGGMGPMFVGALACVASLTLLTTGWGLRHGALWALRFVPSGIRERADVHAYFWGDEHCPGCGLAQAVASAYCGTCGHAVHAPARPVGEILSLSFRRILRPQAVEPARTQAYRARAVHETTDKCLVLALVVMGVGLLLTNTLGAFAQIWVPIACLVPPVLLLFWLRKQDRYEAEPLNLMLLAFGWGILSGFFVAPMNTVFGFAPIAGVTEEITKALIVVFIASHRVLRKEFNGPTDGLVYGACAGLGFAAMENFSYVISITAMTGDFIGAVTLRSALVLNHMMWTGITGSFLGLMMLRNGRVTPRDLFVGFVPAGVLHAANNSIGYLGPFIGPLSSLLWVGIIVATAIAFFKLLAESLRDEAAWGYAGGEAPVEAK